MCISYLPSSESTLPRGRLQAGSERTAIAFVGHAGRHLLRLTAHNKLPTYVHPDDLFACVPEFLTDCESCLMVNPLLCRS